MSVTLLLVAMVIFAFGASHWLTRYASRFGAFSGVEYLIVGVLIGPQLAPRLITADYLRQLTPLISLLLGLTGFIVGLRVRTTIRRADAVVAGGLLATGVLLTVGFASLGVMYWLSGPQTDIVLDLPLFDAFGWRFEIRASAEQLWLSLGLGAAAAVSGSAIVESTGRLHQAKGPVWDLLQTASATGELLAILVLGLTLAAVRSEGEAARIGMGLTEWAVAAVGVGVLCGALFTLFIGRERDSMRMFLASVGAVFFASGIGSALGISPLFVNLLFGMTVALTSTHSNALCGEIARLRHPVYALVMIFAGALWVPVSGWQWLLPIVFVVARYAALRLLAPLVARYAMEPPVVAHRIGHGLLAQGTVAVAIGVSFALRFPDEAPLVLTTILGGTLLGDIWSVRALTGVLLDSGEVSDTAALAGEIDAGALVDDDPNTPPIPLATESPATESPATESPAAKSPVAAPPLTSEDAQGHA
ncbi:MAG: hypothetical protein KC502_18150 [Myxococcales bacterium]|nr:hypothetical protein [Myxococcales bacterium]